MVDSGLVSSSVRAGFTPTHGTRQRSRNPLMIPLGIVWAGYTLVWYGWSLIQDWGIGLTDLIKPSAVSKVDTAIKNPAGSSAGTVIAGNNPNATFGEGSLAIPLKPGTTATGSVA